MDKRLNACRADVSNKPQCTDISLIDHSEDLPGEAPSLLTPATARCRDPDADAIRAQPGMPMPPRRPRSGVSAAASGYRRTAPCAPARTEYVGATALAYRMHQRQSPRHRVLHRSTASRTRRKNRAAPASTTRSAWLTAGPAERGATHRHQWRVIRPKRFLTHAAVTDGCVVQHAAHMKAHGAALAAAAVLGRCAHRLPRRSPC